MGVSESPAVARRHLRLALRKIRESKGFTQGSVAEALDWSISKVNRIEGGEVTVSGTDLRALLALYEVTDALAISDLTAKAKAARRRGWWNEPGVGDQLTPATIQLLQFEHVATAIRVFHPILVPGLLQTRAYAESLLNSWNLELTEEQRRARLQVRLRRRDYVFTRRPPPTYSVILDESVLLRYVGGVSVMLGQLQELISLRQRRMISLRIVQLTTPSIAMIGSFTLVDLRDDESAVLYRESHNRDEVLQNYDETSLHRRFFDRMWSESLDEDDSLLLIQERARAMMSLELD